MNNAEKFLKEFGNIDDEFLKEAMNYTMKKKFNFKPIIAVAACAAFIIAAVPVAKHFAGTLPGHMGGTTATTEAKLGASGKYTVLYAGGADNSVLGAEQAIETDFDGVFTRFTDKSKIGTTKTIEIAGKTWTGTYTGSNKSDYYMDDSDEYLGRDGETAINFSINRETGACRMFYIGGDLGGGEELTRDECYAKGIEHLKTYVENIEEYELMSESKSYAHKGYYFYLYRVVGGIKTSDYISIGVTNTGEVFSHSLYSIGSMKDVDVSGIDVEKVNSAVEDKVRSIYKNYENITTNTKNITLSKRSDGTYVFEYYVSVETDKNDDASSGLSRFVVEID